MGFREELTKLWNQKIQCQKCDYIHFADYQEIEHSNIHTINEMDISDSARKVLLEINDYVHLSSYDCEDIFNRLLRAMNETAQYKFQNTFQVIK